MTSDHAVKRGGIRYRYYASCQDKERPKLRRWRVPAGDLERLVCTQVHARRETASEAILSRADVQAHVARVIVGPEQIRIHFLGDADPVGIPAKLVRRGNERRIDVPGHNGTGVPDPSLVKLIVQAHRARQAFSTASSLEAAATQMGLTRRYFAVLLRLGFLAPDIIAAILDGRQPVTLNRQRLVRLANLPLDWREQRMMLSFPQA